MVSLKINVLKNAFAYFCNWGILNSFGCINFRRICGIPEKSTVETGLNVYSYFQAWIGASFSLRFQWLSAIYASKTMLMKKEY